jgi:hypothetical protein
VIGLSERRMDAPYDEQALDRAANDILKMSIERGDWIKDEEIGKHVKNAPYRPGSLLRKSFGFSNYYKRGHDYLYSKKDLIAFNVELEKRNINLSRYEQLLSDKATYRKNIPAIGKDKPYKIPTGLKDIDTTPIPAPDPALVRQDLAQLKEDFKNNGYAAYVDVYKGLHAMLKSIYIWEKYLEKGLKRRCQKWCDDFNYANTALEAITGKKEKFVAPPDPTQIQL